MSCAFAYDFSLHPIGRKLVASLAEREALGNEVCVSSYHAHREAWAATGVEEHRCQGQPKGAAGNQS